MTDGKDGNDDDNDNEKRLIKNYASANITLDQQNAFFNFCFSTFSVLRRSVKLRLSVSFSLVQSQAAVRRSYRRIMLLLEKRYMAPTISQAHVKQIFPSPYLQSSQFLT